MLRVGAGFAGGGLMASQQVQRASLSLADSLVRLSTLKRINRASEDPGGLIAAMILQREVTSQEAALAQVEQSQSMLNSADSSLEAVSDLLFQIRGDIIAAGNSTISDDQRAALQLEVDSSLHALNRLGQSSYNGQSLFTGGARDFLVGADPAQIAALNLPTINSSSLGDSVGTLNDLATGGSASLSSGDLSAAFSIVDGARSQLSSARVEIGSFQDNTLDTAVATLQDALVHNSESLSQILDADVATESANLVRNRILVRATILAARASLDAQKAVAAQLDVRA